MRPAGTGTRPVPTLSSPQSPRWPSGGRSCPQDLLSIRQLAILLNQVSAHVRPLQNLRRLPPLERGACHAHHGPTGPLPSPTSLLSPRTCHPRAFRGAAVSPWHASPVGGTFPVCASIPFGWVPGHMHPSTGFLAHPAAGGRPAALLATSVSSTSFWPGPEFTSPLAGLSAASPSLRTPGLTTRGTR